jgi:carbonic anhydrase
MDRELCSCHPSTEIDRRRFVKLGSAAAGATMAAPLLSRSALAAGDADALLLNCMDYRLTGKITDYMGGEGLAGKYDQVILAGAALGAVTHKYPAWGVTFREHLAVAIELHHIHQVIVIDHRDCGAYKVILGRDYASDLAAETIIHADMLHRLRREIHGLHPKLEVRLGLMSLDGKVEPIA